MKLASFVFRHPRLYGLLGWLARFTLPKLPRFLKYNRFNAWGGQRELPDMTKQSFRAMYAKREQTPNDQ
jgi:L-lactate dehydrogenase complex protein LldF